MSLPLRHRPPFRQVEASWLPSASPALCKLSDALAEPPPSYRPRHDDVTAWHGATYGARGWELPPVLAPYGDKRLATAAFAAALLGGEVLPCCASLGPELAAPPKWAARPENQVCITGERRERGEGKEAGETGRGRVVADKRGGIGGRGGKRFAGGLGLREGKREAGRRRGDCDRR